MLKPEQTLQLQLEVSDTLTRHTTRDEIGLALAEVINKIVPFDFFLHSIWMPGATSGYRISSTKNPSGKFEVFSDVELENFRDSNFDSFMETGTFLSNPENEGIHQGQDLLTLNKRFPVFAIGYQHGIRSIMVFNMDHDNGAKHTMVISARQENAFNDSQFKTVKTAFPQIKMAFENLFKYEKLKQEEQNRNMQLELNNVLLKHTNREDFALALAQITNKYVPCERFILRVWNGPVQIGYRIPLKRNDDGTFSRFTDHNVVNFAIQNSEQMKQGAVFMTNNSGIIQGKDFEKLTTEFPMVNAAAKEFNIHGIMSLPFKTGETTCILILGNSQPVSFHETQYELMKTLLPQIMLAFDNLLKYQKMSDEEQERMTQLNILTAFNSQKDVNQMALNAIKSVHDFIPFEYWLNVTTMLSRSEIQFRLAIKNGNAFDALIGDDLFNKLDMAPIQSEDFEEQLPFLFENPKLYVGDDFEQLLTIPFFAACQKKLNLQSLASCPLATSGQIKTVVFMGSTRGYAFSDQDLQALLRIMPYISMTAQQYYFMVQIQSLSKQLQMEKNYLVEEIKSNYNFEEIIGTSHLMKEAFKKISQVAATDSTVLILGETGTGKELIARAIHNQSPRKDKVLVKVNCASLPSQLIESELFGHEKGSFTGALEKRIGKFELASGGTIFLDEIGELPLELQAKLLRVLQEREIERIGGKSTIALDVRIIAATNRDLETEVVEGRFRSDLYYRLNVFPIHLPALRERAEDIPMLITHFFQKYSKKMKRPIRSIKDDILQEMIQYEWPGNIRELENVIEQAVIVGDSNSIKLRRASPRKNGGHTPKKITAPQDTEASNEEEIYKVLKMTKGKITGPEGAAVILDMRPAKIEEYERKWILDTLQKTGGRIRGENGAAELLGIKPTTLEARVKKLKIEKVEIFSR
jgi:formate hydrogenlyase transcriptional activator